MDLPGELWVNVILQANEGPVDRLEMIKAVWHSSPSFRRFLHGNPFPLGIERADWSSCADPYYRSVKLIDGFSRMEIFCRKHGDGRRIVALGGGCYRVFSLCLFYGVRNGKLGQSSVWEESKVVTSTDGLLPNCYCRLCCVPVIDDGCSNAVVRVTLQGISALNAADRACRQFIKAHLNFVRGGTRPSFLRLRKRKNE